MTAPTHDPQARADAKRLATLKAAFALRGIHVYDATVGGWLVGAWNLSRYCRTLDDLEAFARQVGAIR